MSLQWLETASQIQCDAVTTKIKTALPYLKMASQAKKESSDKECSTSGSEDEEYAMAAFQRSRDDKNGKGDRKCFRCGDPLYFMGMSKTTQDKNQRAFVEALGAITVKKMMKRSKMKCVL
ncbi:hypothetical protein Tco_1401420 [Tanacetum coccineum]